MAPARGFPQETPWDAAARDAGPMGSAPRGRILVVDDSPANVELLAGILEDEYDIHFAMDGVAALEIVGRGGIDLLLLDIMMPGIDGYEVCRRIKGNPETASVPVIFITAKSEVDDEARGFEIGAVDYITKPISPPILRARVRTHLELKAQRDYLHRLSTIDGLTGIPNRRRFDEALYQEWQRARRNGTPLALLLIDIDFFKRFNDAYGHVAGDDCLRLTARTLGSALRRPGDLAARYGGEEFAIILPACSYAGALGIGEGLRERVAATPVAIAGAEETTRITLSIGAGVVLPRPGSEPGHFVEEVDVLLYQAKAEGRNRVVGLDFGSG